MRHWSTVGEDATVLANAEAPQLPPWDCAMDWAPARMLQQLAVNIQGIKEWRLGFQRSLGTVG